MTQTKYITDGNIGNYLPGSTGYTGTIILGNTLVFENGKLTNFYQQELLLTFNDINNVPVSDASSLTDWNTFFDLPINGNAFTSLVVNGNTIHLIGGSNINLKDNLFANLNLISIIDNNCLISAGSSSIYGCSSLLEITLPALTIIGSYSLGYNPILTTLNLPNLITAGSESLAGNYALTTISLPSLENVDSYGLFAYNYSLTTVNMPKLISSGAQTFNNCTGLTTINISACTNLGDSVGDNNVFSFISGNTITITVPAALMTCNAGNPDADIQYLMDNNSVTVIQV